MLALKVVGGASGRTLLDIQIDESQTQILKAPLMDYLRSKGIPVASACFGEGVCQKCVIGINAATNVQSREILSCQYSLEALAQELRQRSFTLRLGYL